MQTATEGQATAVDGSAAAVWQGYGRAWRGGVYWWGVPTPTRL